jgi:hypothetical protein
MRMVVALAVLAVAGVAHGDAYTVTTLTDPAPGSLRAAINIANAAGPGPHTVTFAPA